DNRRDGVALITLGPEERARRRAGGGIDDVRPETAGTYGDVQALVQTEVDEVNRHLASFDSIKYCRILPGDFSPESGELTPSLKVKRKVVAQRYGPVIEEMYA